MSIEELEKTVGQECSFLSYYLEEYQKDLKADPNNVGLKDQIKYLSKKLRKFDSIYRHIIHLKKER